MKSESIASLLNGSEHKNWILDFEGEVHSMWDLCISGLQKCKGNTFIEVGRGRQKFSVGSINSQFHSGATPACIYLPWKARRGQFNVPPFLVPLKEPIPEDGALISR